MILGLSSFAFAWSIGMDGAIPRHRLTAMPYIPYIPYTPTTPYTTDKSNALSVSDRK
jgi:hypothetical protein